MFVKLVERLHSSRTLIGTAVALAFFVAPMCRACDEELLLFIAARWQQNRAALGDTFLCEFEINRLDVSDPASPRRAYKRLGVWARLGSYQRFSLECTERPALMPRSKNARILVGPGCIEDYVLHAAQRRLSYCPVLSAANLHSVPSRATGVTTTPLCMGIMGRDQSRSLENLIQRYLEGGDVSIEAERLDDGMVVIKTASKELGDSGREWDDVKEWRIDPASGFLPVQLVAYDTFSDVEDEWRVRASVTEVRRLEGGAYWPMVSEMLINTEAQPFPAMNRIITRKMSFDPVEVRAALSFPVSRLVGVSHAENARSTFTYTGTEIGAEQLEELARRADEALRARDIKHRADGQPPGDF
jgi:hypothetical protein